jgi:hypothetical protein
LFVDLNFPDNIDSILKQKGVSKKEIEKKLNSLNKLIKEIILIIHNEDSFDSLYSLCFVLGALSEKFKDFVSDDFIKMSMITGKDYYKKNFKDGDE